MGYQKTINLGCFNDPSIAQAAYLEAATRHFGEFACSGDIHSTP